MSYFAEQDFERTVARAARQRDWDTIDRAIEEQRLRGNRSVLSGLRDAAGADRLPPLDNPAALTIHDLSPEDRARAVISGDREGDLRTFTLPKAA